MMRTTRPAVIARLEGRRLLVSGVIGAAVLMGGLAGAPDTARAQFSVRPVIAHMSADTAGVTTVQVRNEGAAELQLRFYTADFDQTDEGEHRFIAAGEHRASCADRIDVFPDRATLRPGELQQIRVRMRPGVGTCWSLVFAETAGRTRGGISIGQRIGVKVYGVPRTARAEGQVATVTVEPEADAPRARVTFENTGQMPIRPEGALEIRTYEGEVVRRVPVQAFSVLPKRVRHLTVPITAGLPTGRYVAVPVLDFGGDYLAGGQAAFRMP